jgi:hypothetical protein
MGIQYKKTNIHWNYFLALENDFEKISRYIELTEANNKTFSIELSKIIMTATQEVDVIMKKICLIISPESQPKNINHYKQIVMRILPDFSSEIVQLPRFGMSSKPWNNWNNRDIHPSWWSANNKLKHYRTDHFDTANLKNAFNSLGGLLIAILYYYKLEIDVQNKTPTNWISLTNMLKPQTTLFRLRDEYYAEPVVWGTKEW